MHLISMMALPAVLFFAGCATTSTHGATCMKTDIAVKEAIPNPELWFEGTVEQAFAEARELKRPIFLFWNAAWCPPCNEVKSELLSKAQFPELMKPFVPVYLDGDSERAQHWGEKLNASGYPTMLVLSAEGKEIARVLETVNMGEFEAALSAALSANRPLAETIELARSGKAAESDWRLIALSNWEALNVAGADLLKLHKDMADGVPENMVKERALLAGRLLDAAAANGRKIDAQVYLDRIFAGLEAIHAARATIISPSMKNIIPWLHRTPSGIEYNALKARWLAAAAVLEADETLSVANRLSAAYPALAFNQFEHPKGPVDAAVRDQIVAAAAKADARASTPYQRKSVLSWAASLLGSVGEFDAARKLLDKEFEVTDTPWYYASAHAGLEEKAGNQAAALKWSEKARVFAKGRATKLQWIVTDLAAAAKVSAANERHVAQLTKEYYAIAFELEDGFSGRNAKRANAVADVLKGFEKGGPVANVIAAYAADCERGLSKDGSKCKNHFAGLVLKDKKAKPPSSSSCDGSCPM